MHVAFSPYGNFAILTLGFSNRIEVRDVNRPTQVFSAIADVGRVSARLGARAERSPVRAGLAEPRRPRLRPVRAADRSSTDRRRRCSATIPAVAVEKLPAADPRRKEDLSRRVGHPHGRRGIHQLRLVPLRRDRRRPRVRLQHARRGAPQHPRAPGPEGNGAGAPQLDRDAGRGAGLRAPDPRAVRRQGLHAGRRLPRRDARSTARRSEGGPEPRAGRARGVRRARSIT